MASLTKRDPLKGKKKSLSNFLSTFYCWSFRFIPSSAQYNGKNTFFSEKKDIISNVILKERCQKLTIPTKREIAFHWISWIFKKNKGKIKILKKIPLFKYIQIHFYVPHVTPKPLVESFHCHFFFFVFIVGNWTYCLSSMYQGQYQVSFRRERLIVDKYTLRMGSKCG